jgi:hypothetical protein
VNLPDWFSYIYNSIVITLQNFIVEFLYLVVGNCRNVDTGARKLKLHLSIPFICLLIQVIYLHHHENTTIFDVLIWSTVTRWRYGGKFKNLAFKI